MRAQRQKGDYNKDIIRKTFEILSANKKMRIIDESDSMTSDEASETPIPFKGKCVKSCEPSTSKAGEASSSLDSNYPLLNSINKMLVEQGLKNEHRHKQTIGRIRKIQSKVDSLTFDIQPNDTNIDDPISFHNQSEQVCEEHQERFEAEEVKNKLAEIEKEVQKLAQQQRDLQEQKLMLQGDKAKMMDPLKPAQNLNDVVHEAMEIFNGHLVEDAGTIVTKTRSGV